MKTQNATGPSLLAEEGTVSNLSRRRFFKLAGGVAGVGMILSACHKDNNNNTSAGVNLGSGDIGILNYAYALEQLEAAFYTHVISSQYTGITSDEIALLTDIRDHEVAHREFFKTALGTSAIGALTVNFSSIDFSSRASVLGTAKAFEDLGVAAYNGAGRLIKSPDYLLLAGKIVSVEARHAAYIRDLLTGNSFAGSDVINNDGLDVEKSPATVLATAGTYISTKIDASNLPK